MPDVEDDLFECIDELPKPVQAVIEDFTRKLEGDEGDAYRLCAQFQLALNDLGYDMEYGLDGVPYGLRDDFREEGVGPSPS